MNYQPETTHVDIHGTQYAIIDGKWHRYALDKWFVIMSSIEQLMERVKPTQPQNCENNKDVALSGGSCNYYMVRVENPTTLSEPYTVECNDLIESLGLSFKEANIVKEIFRTANERTHGNGKDGNTPKRAAEKILFFAIRNAITNGVDIEKFTSEINLK